VSGAVGGFFDFQAMRHYPKLSDVAQDS